MPHTYHQASGCWEDPSGRIIGIGYAGHGTGVNNPAMQGVPNVGPLPRGRYTIGPAHTHEHLGPLTMDLEPDPGNEMFGRSLFRVHGRKSLLDRDASLGCCVQDHAARVLISESPDRELDVVL